jgi:hypothetical protein
VLDELERAVGIRAGLRTIAAPAAIVASAPATKPPLKNPAAHPPPVFGEVGKNASASTPALTHGGRRIVDGAFGARSCPRVKKTVARSAGPTSA